MMMRHTQCMFRAAVWVPIVCTGLALAGNGYDINRYTIDGGGVLFSTGGVFELSGTIGQPDAGAMSGGEFTLTGGFWFPVVPGDGNGDGVVNLVDFATFEDCLMGPGGGLAEGQCASFDTDGNGTVDLHDFAGLQAEFSG